MNAPANLPVHRRLSDACTAIEYLATTSRSWRAFQPRFDTIDAAVAQADAIARSLRELRQAVRSENTQPQAA